MQEEFRLILQQKTETFLYWSKAGRQESEDGNMMYLNHYRAPVDSKYL